MICCNITKGFACTGIVKDSFHLESKFLLMEPIFTSETVADFYQTTRYHTTEYLWERNVMASAGYKI
jgi:hypothetical protein